MAIGITQAVKEAKVSRATIWRAIKEGRLSVTRGDNKEVLIDRAELFRVFTPRQPEVPMASRGSLPSEPPASLSETADETLRQVIQSHETTIKVQDEALKDLRNRLETTERRLDESERERRQMTQTLTGLLTHQQTNQKTKDHSSSALWWVLGTVLVIAIVVGGFLGLTWNNSEAQKARQTPPATFDNLLPEAAPEK